MQSPSKAAQLRMMLQGPKVVRAVGAHDGLTAKLVEQAGFEAVWASSFEASASHGVPDASLLTMTQYLDAAETMALASDLPVIADCDTGFGGPRNVAYAVARYEQRGISAVCIEDQIFPKMNSFADTAHELLPIKEFVQKIDAGKQAQHNPDTMLIARTEALIAGSGIDAALERAHAYADAGADAVLVHSKSTHPGQVLQFGRAWDRSLPLIAVPTTYPQVSERALHDVGFRVVIYANHGLRAAIAGVRAALATLHRAGRAQDLEPTIATMPEVFALQGMPVPFRSAP